MARILSQLNHRDGYYVHVDPAFIKSEGNDGRGPVITLRDGTVLKLMQGRHDVTADVIVLIHGRHADLSCAL